MHKKKGSNDIHEKQVGDKNEYKDEDEEWSSSCAQKKGSYDIHEPSTSPQRSKEILVTNNCGVSD